MAENFSNQYQTQLNGAINNSVTTLDVDSVTGAPDANFRIKIDDELMLVTAISTLTLTVTRGIEGSTAASHADNAVVTHVLTAGGLAQNLADLGIGSAGWVYVPLTSTFYLYNGAAIGSALTGASAEITAIPVGAKAVSGFITIKDDTQNRSIYAAHYNGNSEHSVLYANPTNTYVSTSFDCVESGGTNNRQIGLISSGQIDEAYVGITGYWVANTVESVSPWMLVGHGTGGHGTFAAGTANEANYVPATLTGPATITGIRLRIGTSSGTICVGLYSESGTRLATSGSVSCPASGLQIVSFTTPYVALPGRYWLAVSVSNNTVTLSRPGASSSTTGPLTARTQANAHPLPDPATFGADANPRNMVGIISGGYP